MKEIFQYPASPHHRNSSTFASIRWWHSANQEMESPDRSNRHFIFGVSWDIVRPIDTDVEISVCVEFRLKRPPTRRVNTMLAETTNVLIATARNNHATATQVNNAAQSFLNAAVDASPKDIGSALRSLGRHLDLPPQRSAVLALVCGALIERGADPELIADRLTDGLRPLLVAAVELAGAGMKRIPQLTQEENPAEVFAAILPEIGATMPDQFAAWEALDQYWRPVIAVYSVSNRARNAAKSLFELASRISQLHEGGHWLALMLSVLDDEPVLVIEPLASIGFVGRISGVVDNFQLNTLLMDVFPRTPSTVGRRVTPTAANVARGEGPQVSDETVSSIWNLYTFQGLQSDGRLPDPSLTEATEAWVWNEGIPADIPQFEGYRVVLLGPSSYARSWPSQRMFTSLPATVRIEKVLNPAETQEWLGRIAAGNAG